MQVSDSSVSVVVTPADTARVLDLYEQGLCLQAHRVATEIGPIPRWTGPAAMVVAGRLAMNLGAPRTASRLHLLAGRRYPEDLEARYYHARALSHRRGPLPALRFMARFGDLDEAEDFLQADWLAFRAILQGQFRDFAAAEASLAKAERIKPEWPWVLLERAHLLEMEDRREESLAFSRRALEIKPWYRPAVQAVAHTLQSLRRDDEALALLSEAAERIENGPVVSQLGLLQQELDLHEEARKTWERVAELSPMMEKDFVKWLSGRRSDSAYECGDIENAAKHAKESGEPFFVKLAERLEKADPNARRVLLDVEFVQQHHQTCAPATLTSIARYWKMPVDHLELADAICYDGTPDHRERSWAAGNGWHVKEFRVTWDSAVALLDAGIPFTLTTVEVVSAHLQAIVGYDAKRQTFLTRDPSFRHIGEVFADGLVDVYKSTGPRGMALVPLAEAARLDGIELPESELYDKLHRLQRALNGHDRAEAALALAEMETTAPEHRLSLQAARILAMYDADSVRLLDAIERLLKLFPDDQLLLLGKLSCLRDHARREDRIALLRSICEKPFADPVFRRQLAQELSLDAREQGTVIRLLSRAMRSRPSDDMALSLLGSTLWDRREFEEATTLYRYASCLDDKDEGHARVFFSSTRCLRRTDEALQFLWERFRRNGSKSPQPARTLFWAYSELERLKEGFAVLDEAMALRPDDGELRLFVAEQHASLGDFPLADQKLEEAKGTTRRASWLRAAAHIASSEGEMPRSLEHWMAVAEIEPAAIDAHSAIVRLLEGTAGREAALAHARAIRDRFPHNYALQKLLVQTLRADGPAAQETEARRLIEGHPADAWARRELAIILGDQGMIDEALEALEMAERLEADNVSLHNVKGQVLLRAGRVEEAREAFRHSIRLEVDEDYAIGELIGTCETRAERLEALAFVESELARQVIFGDGLLTYQRLAKITLEPEELLKSLKKAWEARPDLWHAWSAYARQLDMIGRHDEAAEIVREGIERFPLLPRFRLDMAAIEASRENREAQIEQLRQALRLSPGWSTASRQLSQAYEQDGNYAASREVLEQALARSPLDGMNHGFLADALWHLDEKEAAVERIRRAIVLDPGYDWAWNSLRAWNEELGRPDDTVELARDLTRRRGGDATVWLTLARNLLEADESAEAIAALERASELNPRLVEPHDLRAEALAKEGRFDEARAASRPEVFGDHQPLLLLGRSAWVEAQAGETETAVTMMRRAVELDPDYYWGWRQMMEWLQSGNQEEMLQACDQVVRLAPEHPIGYGYRGDARLGAKDRAGAKADFRHAIELAPSYSYAAFSLFDVLLEDGELDEAESVLLAQKDEEGPSRFGTARAVQLAAARKNQEAALKALDELCRIQGDESWPMEAARKAFEDAGWGGIFEWGLRQALKTGDANPITARIWIELCGGRGDFETLDSIALLEDSPELFETALETYFREAGKRRAMKPVDRALKKFGKRILSSTRLWGSAGYALTTDTSRNRNRQARKFMSDWRTRPDARGWMLDNNVIALRAADKVKEARAVSLHALTIEEDFTTPNHHVWLAIESAIEGKIDEAAELLAPVRESSLEGTSLVTWLMASALIEEPSARGLSPRLSKLRLDIEAIEISFEDRPTVYRTYRRVVAAMAKRAGGPVNFLKASIHLLRRPMSMIS